jgi:FixJ family two-component response regulator
VPTPSIDFVNLIGLLLAIDKQVGGELGISEVTVKAHSGRLMRKMKVRSLAELVSMAAQLPPLLP